MNILLLDIYLTLRDHFLSRMFTLLHKIPCEKAAKQLVRDFCDGFNTDRSQTGAIAISIFAACEQMGSG